MSINKIYDDLGQPKSFTFFEKVKFFLYTGIWPTEINMPKIDDKEFYGIPTEEYQDPTEVNHYE